MDWIGWGGRTHHVVLYRIDGGQRTGKVEPNEHAWAKIGTIEAE